MVNGTSDSSHERVLLLTPTGRDAEMVCERVAADGMCCEVCADLDALLASMSPGAGAVVVAHEALSGTGAVRLRAALEAQEPWSDLPVLLLSEEKMKRSLHLTPDVLEHANITILQRPLSVQLFLSSLRSAVRARRRQYQMRDLYRERERAVQVSDMFVSILGHDLRTPLNAITLSAETISKSSQEAATLRSAGRILNSAKRMAEMVGQLLDFALARQSPGIPLHPRGADLTEVCRQVVEEVERANPQASIQTQQTGELSGVWDPERLSQVVSNLLENAVQHGTRGHPISLELDGSVGPTVRLRVRNLGMVTAEALPSLFQAFKRAATPHTTAGRKGLGLGLFIAREIARAHRGDLVVQTSDGQTVFEVTLPRDARESQPRPAGLVFAST